MENNKEETKDKTVNEEIKDTEIFSLTCLINTILDYYNETSQEEDSSEAWKKGTEHEEKGNVIVPQDVDDLVKKAFKSQLKKFINKNV